MREPLFSPISQETEPLSFADKLAFAQHRIDVLDRFRTEQALRNSSPHFQRVFSLIPLLIHYNHSCLPAYLENAPHGISHFVPSLSQYQQLQQWYAFQPPTDFCPPVFDGLYLMGSIGSITQTHFSDLDYWLCYSQTFSRDDFQRIQQKLSLIQQWAKQLGVDVNFYLMNPQEFKAQNYHSDVSNEHNGSAQHFFLLDEFYRSAIRLAGKRVLWLHIDTQGQRYDQAVAQAVGNGDLVRSDWIDFGDFSDLSIGEYFGASLWQLYKGIESPHKSIIKILLLESYAQTYPKTNLISKQFKRLLLSPRQVKYHFDPYLAMLEQVTRYLQDCKEFDRLDRLRRCFYLKANDGQNDLCRKQVLNELVEEWGWSENEIRTLNARYYWKIKQAVVHQQMIVDQLLQSYRRLIHFARKFQIDPNIMPQDTDMLMRKLYSVFEVIPGKIPLINPNIATNLAEDEVTFIEVNEGVSTKPGWYMVNHAPLSLYDSAKRYVHYQKNLIKAVAWAYFNGVMTAGTQIHLVSQHIKLTVLRQFITDLRLSFPVKPPTLAYDDLHHPNEIRNLIVAINLVNDPTKGIPPLPKTKLTDIDFFNLHSSEQGMIGSISIIYRNMWNEILTQHFEGNEAVLKALKLISNKIYRGSAPPESVNVFCYSRQLRLELQRFVQNLVHRCITVQTGLIVQRQQPHGVYLTGSKWQPIFNQSARLQQIVAPQSPPPCNKEKMAIPKEVYNFASEGFLQFFFDDNKTGGFHVYVLDKQNQVECYRDCYGKKEDKIRQISRLYAEENQLRQTDYSDSFNFPQFYQLLHDKTQISIVPFKSKQHRDYLKNQQHSEE